MYSRWINKTWLLSLTLLAAMPAMAQDQPAPAPEAADAAAAPPADDQPKGLFDRDSLTDGWFGLAPKLKEHGVVLGATEISEVLGNSTGGTRTGARYDGRLELDLDVDLGQFLGIENTVLHVNAFQIHGRGLSEDHHEAESTKHHSYLSASMGSSCDAFCAGYSPNATPTKALNPTATIAMSGRSTSDHPSFFASVLAAKLPSATPTTPPIMDRDTASTRNCARMCQGFAPTAMRTPISRVRSVTLTSMIFMIPIPPTSSDTMAMDASSEVSVWVPCCCAAAISARFLIWKSSSPPCAM